MANVFTPGLKVTEKTWVIKDRRLPLAGEVLAKAGVRVKADDIVARTELPGKVFPINVAGQLSCHARDVPAFMRVGEGDAVRKGQVIAVSAGLFGLFTTEVVAPVDGTVEAISRLTGQVMLREPPTTVAVDAYVDGEVIEVIPNEGVSIKTKASYIQGIFGIGGEVKGEIKVVVDRPDQPLTENQIDSTCRGKIVVGGSLLTLDGFRKSVELGVKAIIVGGFHYGAITEILGYDIGVAVTGSENVGATLVVTEGFGDIAMARQTFDLMAKHVGLRASVNGATQIRAGVVRPEIIVPLKTDTVIEGGATDHATGITIGSRVRAIRHPFFGRLGKVTALPHELHQIDTETHVRVLEVTFDNGEKVTLPRANIEAIER